MVYISPSRVTINTPLVSIGTHPVSTFLYFRFLCFFFQYMVMCIDLGFSIWKCTVKSNQTDELFGGNFILHNYIESMLPE